MFEFERIVFRYNYHCYYVIHICNIEQFENKVTYLLTEEKNLLNQFAIALLV